VERHQQWQSQNTIANRKINHHAQSAVSLESNEKKKKKESKNRADKAEKGSAYPILPYLAGKPGMPKDATTTTIVRHYTYRTQMSPTTVCT